MSLNPPTQYSTEDNLRARQRLWEAQQPRFDLVGWVLDVADFDPEVDRRVLDVGCRNGTYLAELHRRGVVALGCDVSFGMLDAAQPHPALVNADIGTLPLRTASFDLVLAPHMLYHVDDREQAATELRRVTAAGGRCIVVTNGADHLRSLRSLLERAVRRATPGWEMHSPSTHVFSLDNGAEALSTAFDDVEVIRPTTGPTVALTDAAIAADYVASTADHYDDETTRPWSEIVEDVRASVQREIDTTGSFIVSGDTGAFVCR
jgi:SAM-dependent methyltransferase